MVMKRQSSETSAAGNLPTLEAVRDPDYNELVPALYSRAVDIWKGPRGNKTDTAFLQFWFWRDGGSSSFQDPRLPQHQNTFNSKVEISPLLVIDETLQSSRVIGMHLRGRWDGNYVDFDPRRQAIIINKVVSKASFYTSEEG